MTFEDVYLSQAKEELTTGSHIYNFYPRGICHSLSEDEKQQIQGDDSQLIG